MGFTRQALILGAGLIGGSRQKFWHVLWFRRVCTGWRRAANGLVHGQIDAKCRAAAFITGNTDRPVMIADHGLHDGQAEPGSLLLRRVIRREKARAFFRRKTLPRMSDLGGDVGT